MTTEITLPTMTIRGQRAAPNDDVSLLIDGKAWSGWTEVRITRGIERLPSDFEVSLTEFAPGQRAIQILRGAPVQVLIGANLVITGYVDRITRSMSARQHTVTISGRWKCADLVDCAAEWKGGQIVGSSVFEIAQTLADPYGIVVRAPGSKGPEIPQFNLMRGETPYQIIERLCRFGQLLAYDDPAGDLILSAVSTTQAASGFREGVNVVRASFMATMDQRYSETVSYSQSVAVLDDLGEGGDLEATIPDPAVPRHRRRIVIFETSGKVGFEFARDRATWLVKRDQGRSTVVSISTDSFRDSDGKLYTPNTRALVELPSMHLPSELLTIGTVTYRTGSGGTACDLTLMPSEAFTPQPFNVLQLLPFAEIADVHVKGSK